MNEPSGSSARLQVQGISKRYGPIVACNNVFLSVGVGEVHGLLGQNGAGKSTLMKVVAGVIEPDSGSVLLDGEERQFYSTGNAKSAGIGMVHQHFSLVGNLSVWENVSLGSSGLIDKARIIDRIRDLSDRYGLGIDPLAHIRDLSIGEKQRVELIKCMQLSPEFVVLDEPTSVLSPKDARRLFSVIRELAVEESKSVVLVSHRLEEMLLVADRISVMRDGELVATVAASDTEATGLARLMLGESYDDSDYRRRGQTTLAVETDHSDQAAPARIVFDAVGLESGDSRVGLANFNLSVAPGEIHGIAGVEGNGQEILTEICSNLRKPDSGRVVVDGVTIDFSGSNSMTAAGVSVIPGDRHRSGCILDMSLAENLVFGRVGEFVERGRISRSKVYEHAKGLVREFRISAPSLDTPFRYLSGGNQQRAVLAREIAKRPRLLVVSQPTFGLDINAMSFVWNRLREICQTGISVLVISNDLEEILELAENISVINRGSIVGSMARSEFDPEKLGLLIGENA